MSIGLILVIILIIFLLGGFSGRFGGYGYASATAAWVSSALFWSSCSYCYCWVDSDPVSVGCVDLAQSRNICRRRSGPNQPRPYAWSWLCVRCPHVSLELLRAAT